jgi:uncharacterized repeat protein (TIGR01451 family)
MSEARGDAATTAGTDLVIRTRLAVGALLLACLVLAGSVGTARAASTAVSNFSKTGTAKGNGSSTSGGSTATTAPGDTIDWVMTYGNKTGAPAEVTVTDPISGNQTYVPGSLKVPPTLDPQWSTDGGASYVTSEPGSGVNAVGAKGVSGDESTGEHKIFTPPLASFSAGNSQGDGWEALFIGDNLYNIHHHRAAGSAITLIDCHIKTTGAQCPNYPVDYVSPDAGDAFGTGPDVLTNPTYNNSAVDAANGRIFIPMGTEGDTDIGVLCVDVANGESCGYTELAQVTFPNAPGGPMLAGGGQIGSKYYVVGATLGAPVFCYDMTTLAECGGWPGLGVISDPTYAPITATGTNLFELESYGGYIFPSVAREDGTRDIGCIVEATGVPCPGFPKVGAVSPANNPWGGLAPILDGSGAVTAICAQTGQANTTTGYQCWSVSDGSFVGAAPFDQMVPNAGVGHQNLSAALQIATRLYFAYTANGTPNGPVTYTCYDFATSSACQGFQPVPGGQNVRPYTIRQDPYNPDCLWELGDAGVFHVFSATFGGSLGCNVGNTQVQVTPETYYCDGKPGHVTEWNRLRVTGVTSSDYDAVAVTITDADGNAVPGWTNRVFQSDEVPIDISSIPFSGSTRNLTIQMVISWGSHPVDQDVAVSATFKGDAVQVCFQTKVGQARCSDTQSITNTATVVTSVAGGVSDAPNGNKSETATLRLPADPNLCQWDLGIAKEALDSRVVPGKDIRYQIVVTNHGPDTARPVTVKDRLPSGLSFVSAGSECSEAGGIVTCSLSELAAGASRTFDLRAHAAKSLSRSVTNPAKVCSDKVDVGAAPTACDPPEPCTSATSCNGVQCQPAAATTGLNASTDSHANQACVTVPLAAKLKITKVASKKVVRAGKKLIYKIRTTNPGDITVRNAKTCDALPSGLAYVKSNPRAKVERGRYCWTARTLAAGASRTYKVTVRALNGAGRKLVNVATATGDNARPAAKAKRAVRVLGGAVRGGGVTG